MNRQVFYDPQRKRWKRLRRLMDVLAIVGTIVLVVFALRVWTVQKLPDAEMGGTKPVYMPVKDEDAHLKGIRRAPHRTTERKPSEIPLNTDEGLRAAFYVDWDPASYSSLKAHIHQIDMLFPSWLHVINPIGDMVAYTIDNRPYPVVDKTGVHNVDRENMVQRTIDTAHTDTEIFPEVDNFDPVFSSYTDTIGPMLKNSFSRDNFQRQVDAFLASNKRYRGLTIDFQDIPIDAQPGYKALIASLYADLHPRDLRLYINTPVDDQDDDLKFMASHSDGLILMNFDEHGSTDDPGPIASQDWFIQNLQDVLKIVPKEKLICALGSYGYDWALPLPAPGKNKKKQPTPPTQEAEALATQDAWQKAYETDSSIELDPDSLNAHFAFDDVDEHMRHEIWFLDAVTVLNEMRAAHELLGIRTFALWRLGTEDSSLWQIWDKPITSDPHVALAEVASGQDVDNEGEGDILEITRVPQPGHRIVTMDDDNRYITGETMTSYPLSYTVQAYGYDPKRLALSFDDGPDATWTPKILDILKQKHVTGAFFMIGEVAENNVGMMRRVYNEDHEIGNHTFTHPNISEISPRQLELELNFTERLFGAKLGIQPLYFRPPYSIDQEPDTNDEAEPVDRIEKMGYIIVGDKIDTDDWDIHPKRSPQEITQDVLDQIAGMKDRPWTQGSIILLHDGGGDRSATVAALPYLIDTLRARGYQFVPVSDLIGKTRDEVMPKLRPDQLWQARVDAIAFFFFSFFNHFVIAVFFAGDVLMSARLLIVGLFAVIDRLRSRRNFAMPDYKPSVAVIVPAYNEELVIARTVRAALRSDYQNLRVVVVDDGSTDHTSDVVREMYAAEIANGKVTVLVTENAGKAEALNFALNTINEDLYVGIDADTVIAQDAISQLVPHFANPKIGAVAGNAKVGNKVNLWTRWQALEYITSQNFERRALDLFGVVTVVPGAIGAWRTSAVKAAGCYQLNTVAEDADMTMSLLEHNCLVVYEDRALAFTEAPVTMDGLMRQRFRWSFGILQAVFKHRGAFRKHRAMGYFALPNMLVFQILLPLVSPFIDLMFVFGVFQYLLDRHFHPEAASTASFIHLLTYFMAFLIIDFVTSAIAFALERKHKATHGDGWLLFHIWLQRFAYRQVFSIVLFKTLKRAIDGKPFNWDKLERTATMPQTAEES
jgi:cellulose synthase/poly-beta-1,6-N-acetylglucosamine synthase-like glycosyltransferase/peptidoglycan/xylan/chitin deacetylase (PgdA/CDA1 family)/spore germination protein YaaH